MTLISNLIGEDALHIIVSETLSGTQSNLLFFTKQTGELSIELTLNNFYKPSFVVSCSGIYLYYTSYVPGESDSYYGIIQLNNLGSDGITMSASNPDGYVDHFTYIDNDRFYSLAFNDNSPDSISIIYFNL